MTAHLLVLLAALPLQLGIGAANTRWSYLTPGEVRFWGVAVFVLAEFIYLGMLS